MKLLLDTHILLWWYLDSPQLQQKHIDLLTQVEKQGDILNVSVMSLWEIAKLVHLKKFKISFSLDNWFEELEDDPQINIIPLNFRIILESNRLGENFSRDPSDQLIAATARCHGLKLITVDQKIIKSQMVSVV